MAGAIFHGFRGGIFGRWRRGDELLVILLIALLSRGTACAQSADGDAAASALMAGHELNDGDLMGAADAIFVGTVLNLGIQSAGPDGTTNYWRVKVGIQKLLKGKIVSSDKFELKTKSGEAPPKDGKVYLFFAKKGSGIMSEIVKIEEPDPEIVNAMLQQ